MCGLGIKKLTIILLFFLLTNIEDTLPFIEPTNLNFYLSKIILDHVIIKNIWAVSVV